MGDKEFGARLLRLREMAGLTQASLAEAAGVPITTLRNWEHGRREPLASAVRKLASALGVTTDVLLGAAPDPTLPLPPTDPTPPPRPRRGRRKQP